MISRFGELWDRLIGRSGNADPPPPREEESQYVPRGFGERGDPFELTLALPRVLSPAPDVAREAATVIHDHLRALSPRELVVQDQKIRSFSHWWNAGGAAWRNLTPRDVARLRETAAHPASVLGIASFHPDGRVRQAAVEQLALLADGSELPFLLIRLNDWVASVRDTAYDRIEGRIVPAYAPHLVRGLWLVLRLERCGRASHEALVARAMEALRDPASRPALREGIRSPDRWLRRSCYRLLLDPPGGEARETVEEAIRDEDPLTRLRAARAVDSLLDGESLRGVVDRLLRDPFIAVRREGLRVRVGRFPEDAEEDLRRALLDRHPTIRGIARFELRQRGTTDLAGFYREATERASGRELQAALSGLGETGITEDAPRVERFLAHAGPGVRRAAVAAVARLAPEASLPRLVEALQDGNPGVSRAARRALEGRAGRVGAERLGAIAAEHPAAHARVHALSLLAGVGKWEGIAWLVRACAAEDEQVAWVAEQHVRRWIARFNRSFTRPTGPQLERLAAALDLAGPALPREEERMLRFCMRGF